MMKQNGEIINPQGHDIDNELKLMLQGKFKEARAISDKLQNLGPNGIPDQKGEYGNPEMWTRHSFNRGWFLIQEGDYQGGCQLLESGRFIDVYGNKPLPTTAPIFNPSTDSIKGKSIIVSLEGGFGDEIIHARFATSYKKQGAKSVYLAAAPELVSVLERIEGVDGVILRNAANSVAHDYWVPGFSAGWIAGHTFKDFPNKPYLTALPEMFDKWKNIIKSDKLKVGIRWAGNPKFEHQQFRRFPPKFLTDLNKYDGVQLYSLQRDQNIIDLPDNIIDLQDDLSSWEETLGAIQNLDIVITSCTSIAHISAALGKETWVLTPILPYHTWTFGAPHSKKSPYYECVTVYRQEDPKKWNSTFQKLYKDFEKRFKLPHIEHPSYDKVPKSINLGCGFHKMKGFLNVDNSDIVKPDKKVDLNAVPWPFENDEFAHVVAKDILEHLGNDKVPFTDIIKEMYRVSENGALWEVQVPHHRCDHAFDDPTHRNVITPGTFNLFDQKKQYENIKKHASDSALSFEMGVDIEVCEVRYFYVEHWIKLMEDKKITEEELAVALMTQNNVAQSTVMLLQVHKPARYKVEEFVKQIESMNDTTKN
jgi:predicted SAM-dependent methyltransferase